MFPADSGLAGRDAYFKKRHHMQRVCCATDALHDTRFLAGPLPCTPLVRLGAGAGGPGPALRGIWGLRHLVHRTRAVVVRIVEGRKRDPEWSPPPCAACWSVRDRRLLARAGRDVGVGLLFVRGTGSGFCSGFCGGFVGESFYWFCFFYWFCAGCRFGHRPTLPMVSVGVNHAPTFNHPPTPVAAMRSSLARPRLLPLHLPPQPPQPPHPQPPQTQPLPLPRPRSRPPRRSPAPRAAPAV